MGDPEKEEEEERSLCKIDDSFKKIIVDRNNINLRPNAYEIKPIGMTAVGIINFLLTEDDLGL